MNNLSDYEYTGRPTTLKKIGFVMTVIFLIGLFLWLAYYYYTTFSFHEAGNDITIDTYSYFVYSIGGKWLNISLCIAVVAFFINHGLKKLKEDYPPKNQVQDR